MIKLRTIIMLLAAMFISTNHGAIAQNPEYMVFNKAIKVDADTADWTDIPSSSVFEANHLWIGQGMKKEYWKGPSDLSFTWRAVWQQNTLYFLFVVTDDVISRFDQPYSWLNDYVEICIDPANSKGARKDTTNGKIRFRGYEMHFLPSQPAHVFLHDDQPYLISHNQDMEFISLWNGKTAVKYTSKGYILELAFSVPGLKLNNGSRIGLEIAVCDDDGHGRKSLLTWTGVQTDYWISMDRYGVLTLK